MRSKVVVCILSLALLSLSASAAAQDDTSIGPGWLTCPRCQNQQDRIAAREKFKVADHPFNPHDLSGVWGNNGMELDLSALPPLTPWGKQQYDATRAEFGPEGVPLSNSKDGMLICDPLGYPRGYAYNYGFEFVMLPDRVFQFFELGHTWRTIWTDGRKLPEDPPQQRWLGYSVGRWEGDTFVIEGNGYDERSWISEDRRNRVYGFAHSDQMRIVERYKRTSYGTLEASISVIDPKVFTKPWVTSGTISLSPGTELWEYFCVPSESAEYNSRVLKPAAGASK
jgi:hypothetical protein